MNKKHHKNLQISHIGKTRCFQKNTMFSYWGSQDTMFPFKTYKFVGSRFQWYIHLCVFIYIYVSLLQPQGNFRPAPVKVLLVFRSFFGVEKHYRLHVSSSDCKIQYPHQIDQRVHFGRSNQKKCVMIDQLKGKK